MRQFPPCGSGCRDNRLRSGVNFQGRFVRILQNEPHETITAPKLSIIDRAENGGLPQCDSSNPDFRVLRSQRRSDSMIIGFEEVQPRKAGFMSIRYRYFTIVTLVVFCVSVLTACSKSKDTTTPAKAPDKSAVTAPVSTPAPAPSAVSATPAPSAAPPAAEPAPAAPAADPTESITVYVTTKGKNYHRDGCKLLWRSKNPLTLKEALAKGYKRCAQCKPPTAEDPNAPAPPLPPAKSAPAPKKDAKAAAPAKLQ
jgi:hypothetical protein